MKAANYPCKGKIEMIEKDIPAIGEGEALVQVKYAGICGSDIHVWKGMHATATYPRVPGHEFSGVLAEANGTLRDGLKIGDPVVVQPFWSCGMCEPCLTGRDNVCKGLKVFGVHEDGCFAEYVRVPLKKVYRLPDQVPLKLGALTEPLAVAVHDVCKSGLQVGQKALIIGGGPIGILIAMVAAYAGATSYISEINDFRIDFIRSLGMNVISPAKEDLDKKAMELTNGKGFDVVFEVSGSRPGIEAMTRLVKIAGTVMVIGIPGKPQPLDEGAVFAKELKIRGVRIHSQTNFEKALSILESGQLNENLEKLITKVFPLDGCIEAMEYQVNDPHHFKVVLAMDNVRWRS